MDATKCLDNAQWEAYSLSRLSASEQKALQSHVLTCEMCSHIKEGIDALPNPSNLVQNVQEINAKIDQRVAPKKLRIAPLYYVLSAAAILLVSLSVLFFQLPTELVVDKVPNQETQEPSPKQLFPESDQEIKIAKPQANLPKNTKASNNAQQPEPMRKQTDAATLTDMPSEIKVEVLSETPTEDVIKTKEEEVENVLSNKDTEQKQMSVKGLKEQRLILPSNVSNKNNVDYDLNNQIAIQNNTLPIDSSAFKLAKMHFLNEALDSAQLVLNPLLENAFWKEEAQWLQLKIYQKQGLKSQYNALVNKIIKEKGRYSKEALLLLD